MDMQKIQTIFLKRYFATRYRFSFPFQHSSAFSLHMVHFYLIYSFQIWWWYIFRYFECNVPVNLPREYGLPVPQAMVKSRPVQYIVRKFKGGKKEGHRQSSSSADSIQNVE